SLGGEIGIGVEGSNATVRGDDRWHPNSGNDLTLPPLEPYGPATRYIDIFSRGSKECSWTLSASKPWLKLSHSTGVVGAGHPDKRILVSVDWESAPPAPYSEEVQINITTPCTGMDRYGFGEPHVFVPVTVRKAPK